MLKFSPTNGNNYERPHKAHNHSLEADYKLDLRFFAQVQLENIRHMYALLTSIFEKINETCTNDQNSFPKLFDLGISPYFDFYQPRLETYSLDFPSE